MGLTGDGADVHYSATFHTDINSPTAELEDFNFLNGGLDDLRQSVLVVNQWPGQLVDYITRGLDDLRTTQLAESELLNNRIERIQFLSRTLRRVLLIDYEFMSSENRLSATVVGSFQTKVAKVVRPALQPIHLLKI